MWQACTRKQDYQADLEIPRQDWQEVHEWQDVDTYWIYLPVSQMPERVYYLTLIAVWCMIASQAKVEQLLKTINTYPLHDRR